MGGGYSCNICISYVNVSQKPPFCWVPFNHKTNFRTKFRQVPATNELENKQSSTFNNANTEYYRSVVNLAFCEFS